MKIDNPRASLLLLSVLFLCSCTGDRELEVASAVAKAAVTARFNGSKSVVFEDVKAYPSAGAGSRPTYAFCGQVSADGAPAASFWSSDSSVALEDADPAGYARMAESYCASEPHPVQF